MTPYPATTDGSDPSRLVDGAAASLSRPSPAKIYVELTTRCNMRCRMCVKYAKGSRIPEQDMRLEVFQSLQPALEQADALIFSGIGEPLLHPHIADCIAFARQAMRPGARIGLQTNGLLLQEALCRSLVAAGLDTVCISVDAVEDVAGKEHHGSEALPLVEAALVSLRRLGNARRRPLRLGVESVLLRENYAQLPGIVRWAGKLGLDFVLASHMLPYGAGYTEQNIANPVTGEAMALYASFQAKAAREGCDLRDYAKALTKYCLTDKERRVLRLVSELLQTAGAQGLWLDMRQLVAWRDASITQGLSDVFDQAGKLAASLGVSLHLPPLFARHARRCGFIEEQSVFVDQAGKVSPCHFLWHRYTCYLGQSEKIVRPRFYGDIKETPLQAVWRDPEYAAFRAEAGKYDYSNCVNCVGRPCDEVTGHREPFETDCMGSSVPCGHCPWPSGMLACLS